MGIDPAPCDDSFALEAVGRVLAASLRSWAQSGPDTAEGVAHSIIDFVAQLHTLEQSGETVAGVLLRLKAAGMERATEAHSAAASAHPVRPAIA
ncbi:hypothetical protein [Streptomyces sp. NPDC059092]|uniref:hypothetical protein n=1 Tax=Streptomyces sp. NPDC059092 TaxID=3346725 RepID=UPI00368A1884